MSEEREAHDEAGAKAGTKAGTKAKDEAKAEAKNEAGAKAKTEGDGVSGGLSSAAGEKASPMPTPDGTSVLTLSIKRDIALIVISGVAVLVSLFLPGRLPVDPAWVAVVLCGVPIVKEAVVGLVTAFDIKADVLVSLALIASVIIGEIFAAGEVAVIMQLGGLLEELTVARARTGIERLVRLSPRTARVVGDGGEERVVAAEDVRVGDVVRVLPGETLAVDGVVLAGQTSIDESVMTGESMPQDKAPGDEVRSGTVNQLGAFDMRATKVGQDSSIQRMVQLVQSADAGKAKIVRLADSWATWIVVIALVSAVATYLVTGQIIRSVTILVVFCPCALVLATPTAIMAAIGNVTKFGVLVRQGDALERLARVRRVAFDKTGTLTLGRPEVACVRSLAPVVTDDELYCLVAAAESRSEHPLGKAVVEGLHAHAGRAAVSLLPEPQGFEMLPGRGVSATVAGHAVLAGNRELLAERGVTGAEAVASEATAWSDKGCTVVLVALDGETAGFVALSDTLRPDAPQVVADIRAQGVEPVLLTGDHAAAARTMAEAAGIEQVRADCLPKDKLDEMARGEAQGVRTCMVGDGVNDAPALKRAFVGVAMGGVGSDIAMDAADIVLVRDDISALPHLFALSRRTMVTIRLNLTFSLTLNYVAIILAMTGILDPVVGALVHNAGSVLVILNSAALLPWHRGDGHREGVASAAEVAR